MSKYILWGGEGIAVGGHYIALYSSIELYREHARINTAKYISAIIRITRVGFMKTLVSYLWARVNSSNRKQWRPPIMSALMKRVVDSLPVTAWAKSANQLHYIRVVGVA